MVGDYTRGDEASAHSMDPMALPKLIWKLRKLEPKSRHFEKADHLLTAYNESAKMRKAITLDSTWFERQMVRRLECGRQEAGGSYVSSPDDSDDGLPKGSGHQWMMT